MGLDKYSPKEWDWFLTVLADCKILEQNCDECVYENECPVCDMRHVCPVCACFENCNECMPDAMDRSGFGYCLKYGDDQVVDKLIERLEMEEVFKEEEPMEVSREKAKEVMKKYPQAEEAIRELLGCLPSFVIIIRDQQCKNHWLVLSDGEFGPGDIKSPLTKYSETDRARVLARMFGLDREGVVWEWCFTKEWAEDTLDKYCEGVLET